MTTELSKSICNKFASQKKKKKAWFKNSQLKAVAFVGEQCLLWEMKTLSEDLTAGVQNPTHLPGALMHAGNAQIWMHFPLVRTPGKAEHQWPWHYMRRQYYLQVSHHTEPVCDVLPNEYHSQT